MSGAWHIVELKFSWDILRKNTLPKKPHRFHMNDDFESLICPLWNQSQFFCLLKFQRDFQLYQPLGLHTK